MVAGQYGPQYKFEDNRLDLSNVEFVNTMPTLIEFLAEDVLEEGKKKKKSLKKVARRVYHRDYEKTKNKPYRNYDPKRKEHAALTETSLQAFLDEYKAHDTKNALYHDMHLLRLISSQTQPTKVDVTEDSSTVRFFYPTTGKRSDIFEQYKNLFGEPTSRLQRDDVIEATFKDSATGTRVHISHDPKKDFFGSYRLNSNTAMGGLNEYIIQHITTVANMLSEGKISNRDVFLMLIETPGIGQPFGGGTNPDPYGQADLRRDVTGMTDQIVYLRGILAQHLKSDDHDWTFFSNAPTVEDAAHRLIGIVSKLPEAKSANRQAIQQTADQVARVYWGHGI